MVGFEFEGLGRLVSVAAVALHCVARGGMKRTSGFGVDSWSVWMNMVRRPRGARGACMVDVHGEGRTLHCRGEDVRGLVFWWRQRLAARGAVVRNAGMARERVRRAD